VGLGFVLGFLGDPRRIAGALLLLGLGVGGCALADLLDPPDARVDSLADVGLMSRLCLRFWVGLGPGRLGHARLRVFLFRAGDWKGPISPQLFDDFVRLGIRCCSTLKMPM
jgi:hypothetical protein